MNREQLECGMEGSPVRGPDRPPVARLSESRDIENFQAELIRTISGEIHQVEVFVGLFDTALKGLQVPLWVKSNFERRPALYTKLEQGEMAGISHTEENPVLRPANAARSSVVLIPIMSDGVLQGLIGLVSSMDARQLSAEEIESVRQLAYDVAPILGRLQQIEALRRENMELKAVANRAPEMAADLVRIADERNALDALIQMRSHLQANLAHELRTPLAAIRGYARMLFDGRGGAVNSTQKEYLRVVTENTNRLISLVSWMSSVAEWTARHLALSTFDLRDLWADSLNSSRQTLANKSLELSAQIPNEPFFVVADREKLGYVFTELILTAAAFSNKSGTISIEFSHGRNKEVTVKVTGKDACIPPDALTKIFERSLDAQPLAQPADAETISLAGVYDVVGMHGGRVFANSAGQSATFLFTLPFVDIGGEENSHEQAVNSGR
jgi:signal transduction histidine kinase